MKRMTLNKLIWGEKGQSLMTVMMLLLFGSIIIASLMSYIGSGIGTERGVYEAKMNLTYAADSGIEDGLWQVKNDQVTTLPGFSTYDPYAYYAYSSSNEWHYDLEQVHGEKGIVNNSTVTVYFRNIWMPKDIAAPSSALASAIVDNGKLVVFGCMGASATQYQIKLDYYYGGSDPTGANLLVKTLGIWLPPGFTYVAGSLGGAPTPASVQTSNYCSGQAVVWNFSPSPNYPQLQSFPGYGGSGYPTVVTVTFQFSGPTAQNPGTAVSWIDTSGVNDLVTGFPGVTYSWDVATRVYKLTSLADNGEKESTVDAYIGEVKALKPGAAISGDYCAIGGNLMATTTDQYYRDRLFKESSATVQSADPQSPFYIPSNARVSLAYLYWSGWLENAGIWSDSCDDFGNWVQDNDWTISGGYGNSQFRGHHTTGYGILAMNKNVDLHDYATQTLSISWTQSKQGSLSSSDKLYFAFSGNGGDSWGSDILDFQGPNNPPGNFTYTIPSQYLTDKFRMKFHLVGFSGSSKSVYIDNIAISLSTGSPVENARANQIMFNSHQITSNRWQTQTTGGSGAEGSVSYSCFYDVTDLVNQMIGQGQLGANGSGTYTIGHVPGWPGAYQMYNSPTNQTLDGTTAYPLGTPATKVEGSFPSKYQWSYAGWSLVIVYTSTETQGHQLYLYDTLVYCGSYQYAPLPNGGVIGGFIAPEAIKDEAHAASLTCFVGEGDLVYSGDWISLNSTKLWDGTSTTGNSQASPNNVWNSTSLGLAASGVDVDTFTVPYPIIKPGDTSATVRMYTQTDTWNLVYIILSFRSEVLPISTVSYIVR